MAFLAFAAANGTVMIAGARWCRYNSPVASIESGIAQTYDFMDRWRAKETSDPGFRQDIESQGDKHVPIPVTNLEAGTSLVWGSSPMASLIVR